MHFIRILSQHQAYEASEWSLAGVKVIYLVLSRYHTYHLQYLSVIALRVDDLGNEDVKMSCSPDSAYLIRHLIFGDIIPN